MTTNEKEQLASMAREQVDLGPKWKVTGVTVAPEWYDVLLQGPEGRYMMVVVTRAAREAWVAKCWPPQPATKVKP